jgi:hypothetical protein
LMVSSNPSLIPLIAIESSIVKMSFVLMLLHSVAQDSGNMKNPNFL